MIYCMICSVARFAISHSALATIQKKDFMTKKLLTVIILLCLSACSTNKPSLQAQNTYFIQAPFNIEIITTIQEKVSAQIDTIIMQETGLEPDKEAPFFFFKKRAAITVYYVNDLVVDAEPLLLTSLKALQDLPAPHNTNISTKVDFFGEPKADRMALLDLTLVIDDPKSELLQLHEVAKKTLHAANEQYKKNQKSDMYAISKSEQHAYLPHLSIGHLRPNHIKEHIKDSSKADKAIEQIKHRIIKTVSQTLMELPVEKRKIVIDKLSVYDLQKRMYIKDFALKA